MVSMITFGLGAVLLISAISSIPAPPIIFSAVIQNKQNQPIECTISWESFPESPLLSEDVVTIGSMQSKIIDGKEIDLGDWVTRGFIKKIQCGKLVLTSPFEGVNQIETLWEFSVEQDRIHSIGPHSTDR